MLHKAKIDFILHIIEGTERKKITNEQNHCSLWNTCWNSCLVPLIYLCIDTQCFPYRNISPYLIVKTTSFNHKNLMSNQYSATFWVQRKFIVHSLHFKIRFCEIWQKSVVITQKSWKIWKNHIFFDKNQKLATNYWHCSER